jgi:hypothetical protein
MIRTLVIKIKISLLGISPDDAGLLEQNHQMREEMQHCGMKSPG